MDKDNVGERVRKVVKEHLGVTDKQVMEGATTFEELNADSLDAVEIVMALEEEFEIEIPDDDVDDMDSIDDTIKLVESKLGE